MANADMKRLIDSARIKCPGSIDSVITLELFAVLNNFFQATNMWREDITINVVSSTLSYLTNPELYTFGLGPLEGGVINRLISIQDSNGAPQYGTMATPGILILNGLPSQNIIYTVTVAKTVTDPVRKDQTPECPDWTISKYGDDILTGVLARLMEQIAKPYSAPAQAERFAKKFKQATAMARTEVLHTNINRAQTWKFPQGFASRGQRM